MTRALSSGETPSAPILLALFAAFALGVVILWLKSANARIPLMWLHMPVMALLVAPAFLPAVPQTPVPVLMVLFAAAIGTPIVLLARRLRGDPPGCRW